jgi:Tol biopolymer transport system component
MKIDGSQKYFLTLGSEPDWSPDSKKIVFAAPENGLKGKEVIWVINIDGTGRKQITF